MKRTMLFRALAVVAASGVYAWVFRSLPPVWIVFWITCLAVTSLGADRPSLALGAYASLLYGTPRYSSLFDALSRSHFFDVAALFTFVTCVAGVRRRGDTIHLDDPIVRAAVLLFGWLALTAAVATARGTEAVDATRHSSLFLVHSFALLILAVQVMHAKSAAPTFVLMLCAGLGLRVWWQGLAGIEFEGDIGPLVLMVLPLAAALATTREHWIIRAGMAAAAAGCLATAALTYNRATAVGFAVLWAVTLWQARRRPLLILANTAIVVLAAAWIVTTPFGPRFANAWAELRGKASGSETERFHLWTAGFVMVGEHPIAGVGPGRYAAEIAGFDRSLHRKVAHNSYVHMAAEAGWPGLALFIGFFALVVVQTQRASIRASEPRIKRLALSLQGSLAAYLTVGLFISRHDMVLAYVLAGSVSALMREPQTLPITPSTVST